MLPPLPRIHCKSRKKMRWRLPLEWLPDLYWFYQHALRWQQLSDVPVEAHNVLAKGISWAELALAFEMTTRVMLREGGINSPPNTVKDRARKISIATTALGRVLNVHILPSNVQRAVRTHSLEAFGTHKQFGIWLRPLVRDEDHLAYESFMQRSANITVIAPQTTWGKWLPVYRHLPPITWRCATDPIRGMGTKLRRLRTKRRSSRRFNDSERRAVQFPLR